MGVAWVQDEVGVVWVQVCVAYVQDEVGVWYMREAGGRGMGTG